MKYLKLFKTQSEYDSYVNGENIFELPNTAYIRETDVTYFRPYIPPSQVGDVAYWNGSSIKTVSLDRWNESMGTAVGVVVIPSNFLPDGKARIIALNQSNTSKAWGNEGTDISDLVNYKRLPITDNVGSTTTGSNSNGYLPSDKFSSSQSFVDPLAKYYYLTIETGNLIPSPYLSDGTLNPEYMKTIDGYNNALSDFNGKSNTDILVGLSSDYEAANHAKDYTIDGVSGIDWYLPACGELGVMLARLGNISTVISTLGGVAIPTAHYLWSSTECSAYNSYYVDTNSCHVRNLYKTNTYYVRSFALI